MELLRLSARALSEKMKHKEVGVEETVSLLQKRIMETEPEIGAFLTMDEARLAERAAEVQKGIRSGRYSGRLAGVPVAIKDNICTKGLRTTCASKMLEHFVPTYDAAVVERLEAAGMIVMGKTNMDEFAMGSTTETSAFRTTKNPWDTAYVPGGSSGGSCAAVAAGEVPLALGSDTGGSVRQPAAFCGVVGLKPTYGRVSRYGLIAYASSLDQIGPVGRTVADCRALYEVIAGPDTRDATTAKKQVSVSQDTQNETDERCRKEIRGMRIGIPKEYFGEGTNAEVREAVWQAALLLEQNGAIVEEMSLPLTEYAVATYYLLACAEASSNLSRFDGVKYGYRTEAETLSAMYKRSRTEGFGEEVKRRILLGTFVLSEGYYDAYYLKALKVKRMLKEEYDRAFSVYDCLLTPTTPVTAPEFGKSLSEPLRMYLGDVDTVAANLAGLPAISVPCGFDREGMPIGMQMIANRFCEETLFTVAGAYEALRGRLPRAWECEMGEMVSENTVAESVFSCGWECGDGKRHKRRKPDRMRERGEWQNGKETYGNNRTGL